MCRSLIKKIIRFLKFLCTCADPQVKVVGLAANIQQARELILQDLDAKSTRVTLKLDVAFSEHSHVIGKEGANIKKGGKGGVVVVRVVR